MDGSEQEPALWSAALEGDGRAFAAVFRLHRDRVFRHAARLLESDADADEVAAAAFLELWRRRRAVVLVHGSTLPWLLTTATNVALNRRRALRRHRALLDRLPREQDHEDPAATALDQVRRARGESPLLVRLRRLRRPDADLLVLTALEGLTVAEAAGVVGLSTSAAYSRLSRARAALREAVSAVGDLSTVEEAP